MVSNCFNPLNTEEKGKRKWVGYERNYILRDRDRRIPDFEVSQARPALPFGRGTFEGG
jgi:hypothetical protein